MDAIQRWEEAVAAKVAAGKSRGEAVSEITREDPELHAAYLAEYNARHREATRR